MTALNSSDKMVLDLTVTHRWKCRQSLFKYMKKILQQKKKNVNNTSMR